MALGKITKIADGELGQGGSNERWGTLSIGVDGDPLHAAVPSEVGDYRRFYAGVREPCSGSPSKDLATADGCMAGSAHSRVGEAKLR